MYPEFYEKAAANIKLGGQSLVGVFATKRSDETFTYTIGNHEKGLPELILVGLNNNVAGQILNMLGEQQRAAKQALSGDVSLGGQYPVHCVEVTEVPKVKDEYTCQVEEYYGTRDYRVVQVLFPDKQGRYPAPLGSIQ
jgi:hypothetical protein